MNNDRDILMPGHSVSWTIHSGDQGSQNILTGTHRFRTSHHTIHSSSPWVTEPFFTSIPQSRTIRDELPVNNSTTPTSMLCFFEMKE